MELMWKVINKKVDSKISRPSNSEILNLDFSEDSWLGRIIIPWYIEKKPVSSESYSQFTNTIHINKHLKKCP